jgi:hypothetical protein
MKTPARRTAQSHHSKSTETASSAFQKRADGSPTVARLSKLAASAKASAPVQRMTLAASSGKGNAYTPGYFTTPAFDEHHLVVGNPSRKTAETYAKARNDTDINTVVNTVEFQKAALANKGDISANIAADKTTSLAVPDGAARQVVLAGPSRSAVSAKKIFKVGVKGFKGNTGDRVLHHMTKG